MLRLARNAPGFAEYQAFTSVGIPKLGDEINSGAVPAELESSWPLEPAKRQLLDKFEASEREPGEAELPPVRVSENIRNAVPGGDAPLSKFWGLLRFSSGVWV
jgi:hypothetical protein